MVKMRQYTVVPGWEKIPEGWSHEDVADVAVDGNDNVYVFNRGAHPVIVYSADGEYLSSWGDGVFRNPHSITIGASGLVYCVDAGDHTIRSFTADGELLSTWGTKDQPSDTGYVFGDAMSVVRSAIPFNRPTKLCALKSGACLVSDGYGNARVHRLSPAGLVLDSWGEPGSGPREFRLPHSVAASPDEQQVYVADRENHRVQVLDASGRFLAVWTDVSRPNGLYVDSAGLVYVAELGTNTGRLVDLEDRLGGGWSRCSVFDPSGKLVGRWGTAEAGKDGSFYAAHGICTDSAGSVYVAETCRSAGGNRGFAPLDCHTLQKFELSAGTG
jgi:DNA-binding beta-propeller fold protein YncE